MILVLMEDVADLALALILAALKRFCESDKYMRSGRGPLNVLNLLCGGSRCATSKVNRLVL